MLAEFTDAAIGTENLGLSSVQVVIGLTSWPTVYYNIIRLIFDVALLQKAQKCSYTPRWCRLPQMQYIAEQLYAMDLLKVPTR